MNFFKYDDVYNEEFSKIFCYLKTFDISPQRIEFHPKTYAKYQDIMDDMMDMVYYLTLVQGDLKNPQIRLIAPSPRNSHEQRWISLI